MDLDSIRAVIAEAVTMRPPKFEEGMAPSAKVGALEDSMMGSAYMHAELEEALHWLDHTIARLKQQIEQMTGYEVALPRKPRDRITQADVLRAKRTVDRPTFDAGAEAKQLRESILRQIGRFEWESVVLSRVYTLLSGG